MLNVLLTNDDGIEAEGLQVLRRTLVHVPGVRLVVIAPDGNRSAMARSITTRRPLWVAEVPFSDGSTGYATDANYRAQFDAWVQAQAAYGNNQAKGRTATNVHRSERAHHGGSWAEEVMN